MIKINLLPVKAAKKKQKLWNEVAVGILILLMAVGIMAYLSISIAGDVKAKNDAVDQLAKQLLAMKSVENNLKNLEEEDKKVESQLKAISQLQKGRDWFIRVLDKITESVPPRTVWLSSIEFKGKGEGKQKIVIKGSAYDKDSIAIFMGNLSIIPCDDDLEDHKKAPICRDRNERCLKTVVDAAAPQGEMADKWEKYKHQSCKDFYLQLDDKIREAEKAQAECVSDCADAKCKNSTDQNCKENMKKGACANAEECRQFKERLTALKADHGKLHEEEYVAYDQVDLTFIKAGAKSKMIKAVIGAEVYDFEITVNSTNPRE